MLRRSPRITTGWPRVRSEAPASHRQAPGPSARMREGDRAIGRPPSLFVPWQLGNQPHIGLSNETVSPLALVLKCAVSWNLIVEPSEPVRCTVKVEWSTPFCLLSASPNQVVKWPVKDGLAGSSGTAVTVPVIVPVAQKSPALLTM